MRGAGHFHQVCSRERLANGDRFTSSVADWSVEYRGARFRGGLFGCGLIGTRRIRWYRARVLGKWLSWHNLAFHCSPFIELQVSEARQLGQKFGRTLSAHLTDALKSWCPALAATFNAKSCTSSALVVRPRAALSSINKPTAVSTSGYLATPLLVGLCTTTSSSPFCRLSSVFLKSVTIFDTVLRSILIVSASHGSATGLTQT